MNIAPAYLENPGMAAPKFVGSKSFCGLKMAPIFSHQELWEPCSEGQGAMKGPTK